MNKKKRKKKENFLEFGKYFLQKKQLKQNKCEVIFISFRHHF